jgi:hypothetical protein
MYSTLPSIISWHVWLERNKVLFENGRPSICSVVCKSLGGVDRHLILRKCQLPDPLCLYPKRFLQRAGSMEQHTQMVNKVELEGCLGSMNIVFKWTFNCGPGTNTRAELLGVWETLILASRLHISDLQVFGDSRIIIDWLNYKGKLQVISLDCWKDRIRDLSKTFRSINYSHIYRDLTRRQTSYPRRLSRCKKER